MLSFLLAKHDPGGGGGGGLPTPPWGDCVKDGVATLQCIPIVLKNVISAFLIFAGIVAVIIVIVSGYKFTMSGGDQKKVQTAKASLTYAILGLSIIIMAFLIINIIAYITGAQCITYLGFTECK